MTPEGNVGRESAHVTYEDKPGTDEISEKFLKVRSFTEELCNTLETEDYVIQTMPDVSPAKWHLAHTSWFYETFILSHALDGYIPIEPQYKMIFNSYYNAVGKFHYRPHRGMLSRPTVDEVYEYRAYVDENLIKLIEQLDSKRLQRISSLIEVGLNHEQQHQELLITDIKHGFSVNPLRPVYIERDDDSKDVKPLEIGWRKFSGGTKNIGHTGEGFGYDNEFPRHQVHLGPFEIADRLVTNGEFLQFIEDGGYEKPLLWLSDGWNAVNERNWKHPLYWEKHQHEWKIFTLSGLHDLKLSEPVCHVSYYEADAYANWAGVRLPTEAEWEIASGDISIEGNLIEGNRFHPAPLGMQNSMQMFGDVWEWTRSHYSPYPGYKPPSGAIGEYNGKFMCGQFVLKGGSCATSIEHIRRTYRNFFPPDARWQFSGIRLARDIKD